MLATAVDSDSNVVTILVSGTHTLTNSMSRHTVQFTAHVKSLNIPCSGASRFFRKPLPVYDNSFHPGAFTEDCPELEGINYLARHLEKNATFMQLQLCSARRAMPSRACMPSAHSLFFMRCVA
eukprot:6184306-Pleurochrysis_carterae.AAC.2